ncbi:MAG: Abi family protein [Lachnospiraceae bacterium]|nr:Abi family protein [Lachnospiraceae bacterium]
MTETNTLFPINIDSQLKNMHSYVHFTKKARMTAFLTHTGYFRCSRYGKFLISHANDIGTMPTQNMLFQLYDFDTKLRELLFHYCQIAEIQFKTYLADSLSLKLSNATFYLNQQYYTPSRSERNKIKKQSNIRFFKSFFNNLTDYSSHLITNARKFPELKEYRKGGSKATSILPCWVFFSYIELGTIVNIYAYLRGDLRSYVLKYGYSKDYYGKSTTKQFDTWLEALRNLRNICAHHNILVGKTSSIVLPESPDFQALSSNTDLFSRLYALKKILPADKHQELKHNIQSLIKKSKIDIVKLNILPSDWESRFDSITIL